MLFSRQAIRQALRHYFVALAVLVAVFAIEKFDFVLRTAMEHELGPRSFLVLFVAMLPTLMDAIVPVAALVATYFVVLRMREGRELLILAAAGAGARPALEIAGAVGAVAVLSSLAVTGFVRPIANQIFRQEYEAALAGVVARGPQAGRFFDARDTVLHVWAAPGGSRGMRVFSFDERRLNQIFVSDCSRMHLESGELHIDACEARVFAFKKPANDDGSPAQAPSGCRICPDATGAIDMVRIAGAQSTRTFDMKTLFRPLERIRQDEMTAPRLLARTGSAFASTANARRAAINVQQAFVCALGVALAFAAAGFTTPRTRFVALPFAIALLLGAVVLVGSGALLPVRLSPEGFAAAAAISGLVGLASLVAAALLARGVLTAPRLVRT